MQEKGCEIRGLRVMYLPSRHEIDGFEVESSPSIYTSLAENL